VRARERLAAWLRADRIAFPEGDQRFGGGLAIGYETAPLSRDDLDEVYMELVAATAETLNKPYRQAVIDRMRTLVRQRDAALALHRPDGGDESRTYSCCEKCGDGWPCPTAIALGVAR
jgi:hypothetical protein